MSPRTLGRTALAATFSILLLLISLAASWFLFAKVNFLYPLWYEVVSIEAAIQKYGPRNAVKPGFEQTNKDEQTRIFAALIDSIHDSGKGLETLSYKDPDGKTIDKLLTEAEIVHLHDVAKLLHTGERVTMACLTLCLIVMGVMIALRIPPPTMRHLGVGLAAILVLAGIALLVVGPVKLFYWLHTVVFPGDHQWFFYYEESLMSMMMKAPALFGPIALELSVGSIVIWLIATAALRRLRASFPG